MKCFILSAATLGLSSAQTMEDVYGPVHPIEHMSPMWKVSNSRAARPASFYSVRTPDNCEFPLEIYLIQDLTASFDDNFDSMVNDQLPAMFSALNITHPDSFYGLMSFRDKPIWPLGEPATDYCEKFEHDFTSQGSEIIDMYNPFTRVGGGDPPENQFGALLAATQSSAVHWNSNPLSSKLVVMITDSPPHFENDTHNTMNLEPNTGKFGDASATQDCLKYYYPSPDQVLESLKAAEVYLATLVYDPEYWNGLPAKSWQWFNRFIGQTDDFVDLTANNQSDFWVKLSQVIKSVEDLECQEDPTTTEAAITTAPTEPSATSHVETGECEETIICEDDVLVKLGYAPDNLNVVINGKQVAEV